MVKLVLSVDGGGIRGFASTQFLARLEEAYGKPLGQTFDLFVGTSVGAIIVAALGAKQASATEASQMYTEEEASKIFDASMKDRMLGLAQTSPKYNGKGKKKFLENFFGDLELQSSPKPVVITTYDIENRHVAILKSYENDPEGKTIKVADACDASSAAPAYFPSSHVNGRWLVDGGVVVNNPTIVAYAEAKALWPGEEILILSVGTGIQIRKIDGPSSSGWGGIQWLANGLLDVTMDESVVEYQARLILGDGYVRVNTQLNVASDDMDDISSENLKALQDLGNLWFDTFGEKALGLIRRARGLCALI